MLDKNKEKLKRKKERETFVGFRGLFRFQQVVYNRWRIVNIHPFSAEKIQGSGQTDAGGRRT